MERTEVKAIVGREIGPLKLGLGIGHWTIDVGFDLRREGCNGLCTRQYDSDYAFIELDSDYFKDEDQLLQTLRHELFHVVLAPFDVFCTAVRTALDGDERILAVIEDLRGFASEKCVANLDRMWQGLTHADGPTHESDDDAPAAIC